MKAIVSAIGACLIAGSLGTAASADSYWSKEPTVTERVNYADLDLSSARGQKRLKDRISFAAYRLCLMDTSATPSPAIADPVCSRKVMTEGLAQMQRAVARASSGTSLGQARR